MFIQETRWLLNQLIWKISFKMEHFPKDRVENREYLSCHHPNNFVRKFHGLPKYPGLKKHLWVRKSMIDKKNIRFWTAGWTNWKQLNKMHRNMPKAWFRQVGRHLRSVNWKISLSTNPKLWSIRNSSQSGGVKRKFHDHRELGWNTSMVFSGTPLLWREIMMIIPYIRMFFSKSHSL